MDVTLRQLRYLIALDEAGHFGRAAAAVNVSQPALSVQIRALEDALGARLVERRPRSVVATPIGREVLRRARRVLGELGELEAAARGGAGPLRLGVIPTVAPYLLPGALPLLRAGGIARELRVREAQTRSLLAALGDGELDAAIVALPHGLPDLAETPLFEDRFLLGGSEAALGALAGMPPRPEAMEGDRLLLLEDGHCLADQTLAACAIGRDATRVDMRASSLATLCRLVAEGFGLTLVPELAARSELAAAPGLRLLRFAAPEPGRSIGLVRRRSTGDPRLAALAAALAAAGRAEIAAATGALPAPSAVPSRHAAGAAGD